MGSVNQQPISAQHSYIRQLVEIKLGCAGITHVGSTGDQAEQPLVATAVWVLRIVGKEAKLLRPEQVGAIDDRLVHSLDGSGQRTQDNEIIQALWLVPSVGLFAAKLGLVGVGELREGLESLMKRV